MTNIVVGLIGLAIGVALGWLIAQLRTSQRIAEATRVATERLEAAEKIATDRDALATQFKALSAQSMADQNERATQSAQRTMSDAQRLLAPVSLALERLDRRLAEVEQERTDMTASLREQVAGVSTAGESLRKETASLVAALRKPQIRGAWGEMQLQRTAEVAGMLEHCDFQTQQTTTAQGAPQRPDMTVKLSGRRCIHVDAKTPLAAFLEAAQCDDAEEYDAQMARFARHVRTHATSSRPRVTGAPTSTPPSSSCASCLPMPYFRLHCRRYPTSTSTLTDAGSCWPAHQYSFRCYARSP